MVSTCVLGEEIFTEEIVVVTYNAVDIGKISGFQAELQDAEMLYMERLQLAHSGQYLSFMVPKFLCPGMAAQLQRAHRPWYGWYPS
jgi:hypothetical protein